MALRIDIASPCSESWDRMQGTDRVRFCASCKLNVFNTRDLTEPELLALLQRATGGRVCGRVFRRADGTVLTRDCPTGLALLRRRMWMGVSLAVSLVVVALGVRGAAASTPACDVGEGSWFSRVVGARIIEGREALRESAFFGGFINTWFPAAPPAALGRMMYVPPPGAPTTVE